LFCTVVLFTGIPAKLSVLVKKANKIKKDFIFVVIIIYFG
jgi:hypothetical protein